MVVLAAEGSSIEMPQVSYERMADVHSSSGPDQLTSCGTSKMSLSERSSSRRLSSKAQPWQLGWMSRGPRAEAPPLRGIFLAQMGSLRAHSSTPTTIDSTSHMIVLTRSARWRTRLLPAAGAALWGSLCEFLRAWPLPIEVLQCLSFSLPCSVRGGVS